MKPVLGFIIEYKDNTILATWTPCIGYIDGDDVYIIGFDIYDIVIDTYEIKKIPPKRYLIFQGKMKLSRENFEEYVYEQETIDSLSCYPNLTIDEIKRLRIVPERTFKSLVGKTYEFQPFTEQI